MTTTATFPQKPLWLGRALLAVVVGGVLTFVLAPRGIEADYAGTGLLLAPTNYGLVVPLLALGAAMAEFETLLLIEALALFAAGLAVMASISEGLLLAHQEALSIFVRFPLTNCALALASGAALLAGPSLKGIPSAAAALLAGAAFGTTIGLYSPGDDASIWFTGPASLAGTALVLFAAFALAKLGQTAWLAIARKILGSWLIATGILLAGFPLVPRKPEPPELPAAATTSEEPPGFDASRQP